MTSEKKSAIQKLREAREGKIKRTTYFSMANHKKITWEILPDPKKKKIEDAESTLN